MTTARIVQLYPEELGVAGDRGNVLALSARLEAAGIHPDLVEHRVGDLLPESADVVVIGGGPLSAMRTILDDLRSLEPALRRWLDEGVPVFAYGSGAELLSTRIDLLDGSAIDGLGVLPFTARRVSKRTVGYAVVDSDLGRLVGFEDNASDWLLDAGAAPLGHVVSGDGNGDGREGMRAGATVATQLGGPVLPLNPALTAVIVETVARRLGVEIATSATEGMQSTARLDDYAERAREVMIGNAEHVFSRI
ncbi:MAG: hypothetical protein RI885_1783 [Actinomycetota bacterium]|jgi:CobQ-like glutamine amidotransferase family enzyme